MIFLSLPLFRKVAQNRRLEGKSFLCPSPNGSRQRNDRDKMQDLRT
jgi:hypothetical protein